jgi:hypothetical protein
MGRLLRIAWATDHRLRRRTFKRLAGAAVAICAAAALFVVLSSSSYVTPPIDSYSVTDDGRIIELNFDGGIGDVVAETQATEETDRVVVSVKLRQTIARKVALGIPMHVAVTLQQPLGSRRVDDNTGRNIPRSAV